MDSSLPEKIGQFFISKQTELISNKDEYEPDLLKLLGIEEALEFKKDDRTIEGFFGWSSNKSDYRPKNSDDTIIEVKYIRTTHTQSGPNYGECHIKESLSQIIEQASCKKAKNAILVIIDSGRACNKEWTVEEEKFISMFKNNPFGIGLSVVRVQFDQTSGKVSPKIY